ncbi:hypothetical protein ACGFZS_47335 [Streptomyces sp. NPDC048288]|uniref:hypothetical protein n=1 Tax=Streptomyces sp. NPDC048288 TaxID=3365529 RepID=UPI0037127D9B
MSIVNLTPRVVRIYNADRPDSVDDIDLGLEHVIDPAPQAADLEPIELVTIYQDEVPVELIEYGHADNLPAARDGVFYIVPLEVALALHPRRTDLLVTHTDVTTSDGTVIGCRSLAQPT